jgi:hypothetical protein
MSKLVRRWYWWLPALLVAAVVGYVGYRAAHPPWADTQAWAKYRQVQLGMSEDQVKVTLGSRAWVISSDFANTIKWTAGDDQILVNVGVEDAAYCKSAMIQGHEFSDPPAERHWWDRVRDWLGW